MTRTVAGPHRNLAKLVQDRFDVSRPTANRYIRALIEDGVIRRAGRGQYELAHSTSQFVHELEGLEEHVIWHDEIEPCLRGLPQNVLRVWHYGCTEMINNAIDHSAGQALFIRVDRTALATQVDVLDDGVGIFRKIANALGLEDDRHAVLELAKGKFTTDPENHTGEGIFFSSKTFDEYMIMSRNIHYSHDSDTDEDWIMGEDYQGGGPDGEGTLVRMALANDSPRKLSEVFDRFTESDYGFDRTVVPVRLLAYGEDRLVSRSQAKRLISRFERFGTVVLDFAGIESIGQAFADEVFRVFAKQHPEIELVPVNAGEQVSQMITRAIRR